MRTDDFGWADADWHRTDDWPELATPNMLAEVHKGVELDNMYAFKFCAPSRSAIQSGRNPVHVNVQNYQPTVWDSGDAHRDKVSGYAGIPTEMTGIASVLRGAGYSTHFAGKRHLLLAPTHAHMIIARALRRQVGLRDGDGRAYAEGERARLRQQPLLFPS